MCPSQRHSRWLCAAKRPPRHRPVYGASLPSHSSIMAPERNAAVGFALPRPCDVGRAAVARLEDRVFVTDVTGGRHPHAADQTCSQIRQDVPEHVLGHQHIECPRPTDHVQSGRIHVCISGLDIRKTGRALVKYKARAKQRQRRRSPCRRRSPPPARHPVCVAAPGEMRNRTTARLSPW